jgi:hypothetical protein
MDWETIIPRSTINICPTMMLTEEPQNLDNLGLQHTEKTQGEENLTSPSPHNARTAIKGKGERA